MTSISTLSFNTTTRTSLLRLQGEVNDLAQQMNTGRLNDVGRTLGRLTGSAVSARSVGESLKEQQTSNDILDRRLNTVEVVMTNMREKAESVANGLIGLGGVGTSWATMVQQAQDGMSQMKAALNTSDGGNFIFGGVQSDQPPIDMTRTAEATATAKAHFAAFVSAANTAASRVPADSAALITADEMTRYLTSGYDVGGGGVVYKYTELFEGLTSGGAGASAGTDPAVAAAYTNWDQNWSNASSDTGQSRISSQETVTSLATANDPAFRKMAAAYSMLADLSTAGIGDAARTVLINTAATTLKTASTAITALGASVGTTRKRIEMANTELQRQEDIMTSTVSALEDVDTTEISTKVLNLKTQLEVAYTVTGKIQNLSLLNYL